MMKKWIPLVLFCIFPIAVFGQTGAIQGYCDLGASPSTTSGLNSSNFLQGIIPQCTVTVYLTGTTTLATIYKDSSNTPLDNPFTATTIGKTNTGKWIFWASTSQAYDIVMTGGIPPNTYPLPVTLTDIYPSSAFSVSTSGNTGGSAAPSGSCSINWQFFTVNSAGPLYQCVSGTWTQIPSMPIEYNGSTSGIDQNLLNFTDNGTISIDSGYQQVKAKTNTGGAWTFETAVAALAATQFSAQTADPLGTQHVTLYPCSAPTITASSGSGGTSSPLQPFSFSLANVHWEVGSTSVSAQYTGFCMLGSTTPGLPSNWSASNVTAAYWGFTGFFVGGPSSFGVTGSPVINNLIPSGNFPTQVFSQSITSPQSIDYATANFQASLGSGVEFYNPNGTADGTPYLVVYDAVDPAPAVSNNVVVEPPLSFANNTLSLSLPLDGGVDSGSANAYVVNTSYTGIQAGQHVTFTTANPNTITNPTLTVEGLYPLGAGTDLKIVGPTGQPLCAGDIGNSSSTGTALPAQVMFLNNNSSYEWALLNPQKCLVGSSAALPVNTLTASTQASSPAFTGTALSTPSAAPTLTAANANFSGTLPLATYYGKIALPDANGFTTTLSPETPGATITTAGARLEWYWPLALGPNVQLWEGTTAGAEDTAQNVTGSVYSSTQYVYYQLAVFPAATPPTKNLTGSLAIAGVSRAQSYQVGTATVIPSAATGYTGTAASNVVMSDSPTLSGTVTLPAPTLNNVTGSTQCLQVDSGGVVSGTGALCGSGSGTGTMSDGAGTTTAGYFPLSTITAHTYSIDTNLDDGHSTANTLTYLGSGGIAASTGPIIAQSAQFGSSGTPTLLNVTGQLISSLPGTGNVTGDYRLVTDGTTQADCSTGGGTTQHWCYWTGSAWTSAAPSALADPGANGIIKRTALNTTAPAVAGTDYVGEIASGTATLGTTAISANSCATAVTATATGVATTDVIMADFNSDPSAITGYGPSGGGLTVYKWPSANQVNFKVCNPTSASITPGAATLNWRVVR